MRPRVFPAEDFYRVVVYSQTTSASMRPRVFPAEDSPGYARVRARRRRFNEAAGIPRGRQFGPTVVPAGETASMRPRVFPAEDSTPESSSTRAASCFNEAAGIPRGRRWSRRSSQPRMTRFNEAAGIPRGRHAVGLACPRRMFALQ